MESVTMMEPEPEAETAVDRVATLLADVAGGERAEVNVYRIEPDSMEFCCKLMPDEFEAGGLDLIRRRFGPGEYEIRLYATQPGSKRFAVRGKTRVKIAQDRGAPEAAAAPGHMAPDATVRMLEAIAAGQQQIAQLLADGRAPVDPMESMRGTLEMMTLFRNAMGDRQQSPIGEIVAAVRELRGAAEELQPARKEAEEDRTMAIFNGVMPVIQEAMKQRGGAPAPAFAPVALPPARPAPAPGPAAAAPVAEVEPPEVRELRSYVALLVSLASVRKPATTIEAGADLVYEKMPDEAIAVLRGDQWFEMLTAIAPETAPHKAWLDKVRIKALAMIDEDAKQDGRAPPV